MAAITVFAFIPLLFVIGLILFAIIVLVKSSTKRNVMYNDYRSSTKHERYVPGEFSNQMELDMRLPYRRFKKLYPRSNLTYQQYKDLQVRKAFRRSMSSQDNQRMVR